MRYTIVKGNDVALSEPQKIWLSAHPHRSAKWLRERIADGFDVHHIDGDELEQSSDKPDLA